MVSFCRYELVAGEYGLRIGPQNSVALTLAVFTDDGEN